MFPSANWNNWRIAKYGCTIELTAVEIWWRIAYLNTRRSAAKPCPRGQLFYFCCMVEACRPYQIYLSGLASLCFLQPKRLLMDPETNLFAICCLGFVFVSFYGLGTFALSYSNFPTRGYHLPLYFSNLGCESAPDSIFYALLIISHGNPMLTELDLLVCACCLWRSLVLTCANASSLILPSYSAFSVRWGPCPSTRRRHQPVRPAGSEGVFVRCFSWLCLCLSMVR